LELEEKIWSFTIAERGSDDLAIRFGICIAGENANIYEQRDETKGCRLRQEDTTEKQFPLQPGRRCRCCNNELYWSSYDKPKFLCLQATLTNDMVQSYVCDEVFKQMNLSLKRGDVEKFDEKWSKMFSIGQAYWKHPRGLRYAWREGVPKEGYEAVVKRFRNKPMYTQDDMDLRLLEPFDNGTIVGGEMIEELIFVNYITVPELGIRMPSNSYVHESAKEPTAGQGYIKQIKEMRLSMNWGCHGQNTCNHGIKR
jgi:hypothetical protein